jgi:hypothetical protein
MKTPDRALNDLMERLFGARVVRTRKFTRFSGEIAHLNALKDEAERRGNEQQQRAEQAEAEVGRYKNRILYLPNGPVNAERILMLGRLLRPWQAKGFGKVRLGAKHDAGYICLDDFKDIAAVLSFGIGKDSSWDAAIADMGLVVHQYDHSVTGPPRPHANFRFHQRELAGMADASHDSIESILADNNLTQPASVILKIDIEQAEWEVFARTPVKSLKNFAQVICEFHDFENVADDRWFERAHAVLAKLNEWFAVVHVHANNYGPLVAAGTVMIPQVLEVSYVNRARYTLIGTDETFPGPLDSANRADVPDHDLGKFSY